MKVAALYCSLLALVTARADITIHVTPASGTAMTQAFVITYTDSAGAGDIAQAHFLLTPNSTGSHACYLIWQRPTGFWLATDEGGIAGLPMLPGTLAILKNSQCQVAMDIASVTEEGNAVVLHVTVEFTGLSGVLELKADAYTIHNVGAGFRDIGTFTAGAPEPLPPLTITGIGPSGALLMTPEHQIDINPAVSPRVQDQTHWAGTQVFLNGFILANATLPRCEDHLRGYLGFQKGAPARKGKKDARGGEADRVLVCVFDGTAYVWSPL